MYGATRALQNRFGLAAFRTERARLDRWLLLAQQALGEVPSSTEVNRGLQLTFEQAITLAMTLENSVLCSTRP